MRVLKFFPLVLLALVISCFGGNNLEVTDRNFSEEVEQLQNLIFTFNQDIVNDDQTNVWEDIEYAEFTPKMKGRFKWQSKNELVFSPLEPFKPATKYSIELSSEIAKRSQKDYKLTSNRKFDFHTPSLKLTGTEMYWAKSSSNPGKIEIRTNLIFNYKVNPAELKNLLSLTVDGKSVTLDFSSLLPTEKVSVSLPEIGVSTKEKLPVKFTVAKGFLPVGGEMATEEPLEFVSEIPSKDKLQIINVTSETEDENSYIRVFTNQSVDVADLKSLVKIEPSLPFTVENLSDGFKISGDFIAGTNYELTISKKIKGLFGTGLEKEHQQYVTFGQLKPAVKFTSSKGIYLTSKGSKTVGVKISAIPKVKVTIVKIYENNMLAFLKHGSSDGYYYDEESDSYEEGSGAYYSGYYNWEEYGDLISEREIETKNLEKVKQKSVLNLDFKDEQTFKGVYVVNVASTEDQWIRSNKLVSISDIGLIAKQSENEIWVFANSIQTAEPISGVKLQLISSNNQSVYSIETDSKGVAVFRDIKQKAPNFRISMITARNGDDFNYMYLRTSGVETSRFDVGGLRDNPSGYQSFIYGERELYRPGETIKGNVVVRNDAWEVEKEIPIKLKLLLPNGHDMDVQKKTLNEQGASEFSFKLNDAAVTGTYTIEVYTANDVLLNSKSISVEEFIPDRIKVTMALDKKEYELKDEIKVSATALNLFGPPAANRNYEANYVLKKRNFTSKNFRNYIFNLIEKSETKFEDDLREGKTDEKGELKQSFATAEDFHDLGVLQGRLYVTVFDESGRPVNRVQQVDVWTQSVFYGIKNLDYYMSTRDPITVPVVAVDKSGNALTSVKANLKVIRYNWQTVLQKNSWGGFRYVSQKQELVMQDQVISISGDNTTFTYTPNQSGEYEIRISKPGVETYVAERFYAYSWGDTQSSSFEVSNEGQITIEADKEIYETGETANLLFKTPFAGKLLVTVERNKVYDYFYLETDKKSATLPLNLKEDYLPNVYISATLFKPVDDGSMPLTVAHGFQPITVQKSKYKIPVKITAVEKSRSQIKQKIKVKGESNSDITISIVDEGILQLKDSKTPDPFGFFFQKRALEVSNYDVYPFLFPELKFGKSSTGGDGYDMARRVNPFSNKRVNPVSFWTGILKTDSDGEAETTIDIPKFSGDLRIMAVAYKNKSFGSAESHIKVADPIVISTSLPRFASPKDSVLVPVTLTNTTSSTANATVKITATGPLSVSGESSKSVSLSANKEGLIQFAVVARPETGNSEVTVTVSAMNETFIEKIDMTVRPASSLQKLTGSGEIKSGSNDAIDLKNNFIPVSTQAKLVISKSPIIQFSKDLSYLVQYPYGCVEQTVSTAFPQIYFQELAKTVGDKKQQSSNPNYNVQQAIRKLESMQLYNGALSYWEGGDYESWWGTVYAAHFMYEARKAGFEVKKEILDKMYGYLAQKVKEKQTERYYYYNAASAYSSRVIASKEICYSLFILSLAGKADQATMNYYRSNQSDLALDSKYLLAASYLLIGDQGSYKQLIPKSFEGERSKNSFGGNFYSYVRDEAISLNAILEVDPDNQQIGILAKHLSEQMKAKRYLSTQETAFGLLALGKIAAKSAQSNATGTVSVNGKTVGTVTDKDLTLTSGISGEKINVTVKGTGSLYYFWEVSGISVDGGYKAEDSFLRVRKTFLSRSGNLISGASFEQNDLIVIKITASATDNSSIENVVITDLLPAGFEIENPRIGSVPELNWITNNTTPDHFDIRDDRINYFTTLNGYEKNFYYLVRAVSKGTFQMGPVSADAMYDGEYHSINGAGTVTVK